jgi:hypothetical protein
MILNSRVKAKQDLFIFSIRCKIPAGATGTVVAVYEPGSENYGYNCMVAEVKLDEPIGGLEEWDNHLQVFTDEGGEITENDFEPAEKS